MLTAYHWPGNVRELQNVIERAVLVCDGHVVHAHHLPPTLQTAEASGTVMSVSLDDAVDGVREGPAAGRAEERARQPRQGRAAAAHDRSDLQLQGAPARDRLEAVQAVVSRKRLQALSQVALHYDHPIATRPLARQIREFVTQQARRATGAPAGAERGTGPPRATA